MALQLIWQLTNVTLMRPSFIARVVIGILLLIVITVVTSTVIKKTTRFKVPQQGIKVRYQVVISPATWGVKIYPTNGQEPISNLGGAASICFSDRKLCQHGETLCKYF